MSTTMDSWSSIPWRPLPSKAVYKHKVPYKSNANDLQNLEIWLPISNGDLELPSSSFPSKEGLWIIYIHGGAWRDPRVTSSSFEPTVNHLLSHDHVFTKKVAGIASISYSLTPYHTPSKDEAEANDPSRQHAHPDHIIDVLTGIKFLQDKAGFGSSYILLGHSCGATLAFQVAMNASRWCEEAAALGVAKPKYIVGLNGLYDMPTLIRKPDASHAALKDVYEEFTRQAFGADEKVWRDISPVCVEDWKTEWKEGVKVVLVQSKEDTLVPYSQLNDFRERLLRSKAEGLEITEMDAYGDHNELWEKGDRLAEIIEQII